MSHMSGVYSIIPHEPAQRGIVGVDAQTHHGSGACIYACLEAGAPAGSAAAAAFAASVGSSASPNCLMPGAVSPQVVYQLALVTVAACIETCRP
jgi:hypothetical protein